MRMAARLGWLVGGLLAVVGCHSFTPMRVEAPAVSESPVAQPAAPTYIVRALDADPKTPPDHAENARPTRIALAAHFEPSGPNHLTLAASQLEKGDEAGACAHLALYLASHPEHTVVRVHFAELLLRQNHPDAAREQFERFESEAQEQVGVSIGQRIRCESRLATMAETREDEYEEHLHRGIGLYLLASERMGQPEDTRELRVEALLFKAASELAKAHSLHREEARPNWYLHEIWARLGQRHAAFRRLKAAEAAADFTYLTPTEHRDLLLARQRTQRSREL
jgi:hypothetical protein